MVNEAIMAAMQAELARLELSDQQTILNWLKPKHAQAFQVDPTVQFDPVAEWETRFGLLDTQKAALRPADQTLDLCLYQGGLGCGKTYAGVLFGLQQAFAGPYRMGMVLAANIETLRDSLWTEYDHALRQLGLLEGKDYLWQRSSRTLRLKNGSVIHFRTVRQRWHMLNCHWLHIEHLDDIEHTTFEQALSRLTYQSVRVLATTRPLPADHWAVDWPNQPYARQIIGSTADNRFLPSFYLTLMQPAFQHKPWLLSGQTQPPTDQPNPRAAIPDPAAPLPPDASGILSTTRPVRPALSDQQHGYMRVASPGNG